MTPTAGDTAGTGTAGGDEGSARTAHQSAATPSTLYLCLNLSSQIAATLFRINTKFGLFLAYFE